MSEPLSSTDPLVIATHAKWLAAAEKGPIPVITCDADLMGYLGFTAREQDLIATAAKERGLSVPEWMAQIVGRLANLGAPFDCGHRGFLSIYPRPDGGTQCTACSNAARNLVS
jgi:hypothetical protein